MKRSATECSKDFRQAELDLTIWFKARDNSGYCHNFLKITTHCKIGLKWPKINISLLLSRFILNPLYTLYNKSVCVCVCQDLSKNNKKAKKENISNTNHNRRDQSTLKQRQSIQSKKNLNWKMAFCKLFFSVRIFYISFLRQMHHKINNREHFLLRVQRHKNNLRPTSRKLLIWYLEVIKHIFNRKHILNENFPADFWWTICRQC